jgi:MFS family permease
MISASLHSASGYVWIGAAYLVANTAAGPIWAKFSDIWGRKPALLGAVSIFAVGSIIAALSTSMRMLIAARALQGTAGGALMSLVVITISDLFSMRTRGLYMGFMGVVWAVAGTAGPVIGGALTQLVSWRWCFWINLPVCAISFVLLLLFLDVHNPRTKLGEGLMAVDWCGTLSILAVTLLLLLGLDFGGTTFPWDSPKVIGLIVFGTLMIGVFLFSEKRLARYPLMLLSMFENWSNNATFLLAFAHSMVAIGVEYYLPLYFQSVKRASPIHSGILMLPMMVTTAAVDITVGIVIHRTGRYREITWAGATIMTLGTGLYINFRADTSMARIIGFEIVGGIGVALLFQTPMIAM